MCRENMAAGGKVGKKSFYLLPNLCSHFQIHCEL